MEVASGLRRSWNDRIGRAQRLVEEPVAIDKDRRIVRTEDGVGAEKPAEEEDFGEQKDPHPQLGRFHLLFGVGEVVLEPDGFGVAVCSRFRQY